MAQNISRISQQQHRRRTDILTDSKEKSRLKQLNFKGGLTHLHALKTTNIEEREIQFVLPITPREQKRRLDTTQLLKDKLNMTLRQSITSLDILQKKDTFCQARKDYIDMANWLKTSLTNMERLAQQNQLSQEIVYEYLNKVYGSCLCEIIEKTRVESTEKAAILKLVWENVMDLSMWLDKYYKTRLTAETHKYAIKCDEQSRRYMFKLQELFDKVQSLQKEKVKREKFFYDVVKENRKLRRQNNKLLSKLKHENDSNNYLKEQNLKFYRDNEKMKLVISEEDRTKQLESLSKRLWDLQKRLMKKTKFSKNTVLKEIQQQDARDRLDDETKIIVQRLDEEDLLDLDYYEPPRVEELRTDYYSTGMQTQCNTESRSTNTYINFQSVKKTVVCDVQTEPPIFQICSRVINECFFVKTGKPQKERISQSPSLTRRVSRFHKESIFGLNKPHVQRQNFSLQSADINIKSFEQPKTYEQRVYRIYSDYDAIAKMVDALRMVLFSIPIHDRTRIKRDIRVISTKTFNEFKSLYNSSMSMFENKPSNLKRVRTTISEEGELKNEDMGPIQQQCKEELKEDQFPIIAQEELKIRKNKKRHEMPLLSNFNASRNSNPNPAPNLDLNPNLVLNPIPSHIPNPIPNPIPNSISNSNTKATVTMKKQPLPNPKNDLSMKKTSRSGFLKMNNEIQRQDEQHTQSQLKPPADVIVQQNKNVAKSNKNLLNIPFKKQKPETHANIYPQENDPIYELLTQNIVRQQSSNEADVLSTKVKRLNGKPGFLQNQNEPTLIQNRRSKKKLTYVHMMKGSSISDSIHETETVEVNENYASNESSITANFVNREQLIQFFMNAVNKDDNGTVEAPSKSTKVIADEKKKYKLEKLDKKCGFLGDDFISSLKGKLEDMQNSPNSNIVSILSKLEEALSSNEKELQGNLKGSTNEHIYTKNVLRKLFNYLIREIYRQRGRILGKDIDFQNFFQSWVTCRYGLQDICEEVMSKIRASVRKYGHEEAEFKCMMRLLNCQDQNKDDSESSCYIKGVFRIFTLFVEFGAEANDMLKPEMYSPNSNMLKFIEFANELLKVFLAPEDIKPFLNKICIKYSTPTKQVNLFEMFIEIESFLQHCSNNPAFDKIIGSMSEILIDSTSESLTLEQLLSLWTIINPAQPQLQTNILKLIKFCKLSNVKGQHKLMIPKYKLTLLARRYGWQCIQKPIDFINSRYQAIYGENESYEAVAWESELAIMQKYLVQHRQLVALLEARMLKFRVNFRNKSNDAFPDFLYRMVKLALVNHMFTKHCQELVDERFGLLYQCLASIGRKEVLTRISNNL